MVDFKAIYSSQSEDYDLLVSREDYQKNIDRALQDIRPFEGLAVADMGSGTGRVTRILAPFARRILAMDISAHMLSRARDNFLRMPFHNWDLAQADNLNLPIQDHSFDIAISGWSLGHLTGWYPDSWLRLIDQCLSEKKRILRPGGTIIVIETLGTGRETPQPPTEDLAAYYSHLEKDLGFSARSIRTDYRFQSVSEAVESCRFFFGEELAQEVASRNSPFLPECTGIWWASV